MSCIPFCFPQWSLPSLQKAAEQQVEQLRVQGNGAAGLGRGDLGPRHSRSLGLPISVDAFDPKNSSTSNLKYAPKLEEGHR